MTIRTDLLANLTIVLSNSSIGVSAEYPWESGGVALYNKNLKKLYLDKENIEVNTLHRILQGSNICERTTTVTGYITVDAKNQPSDIEAVLETIVSAKNIILSHHVKECDITTETEEDRITYEFVYRFVRID